LFIDHVETEWCFRAQRNGWNLYGTKNVVLEHRMGDNVVRFNILGTTLTLPYRSPHRHRYLMRNSVEMLRRPYIPLMWKAYCVAKIGVTGVLFGALSEDKAAQARAIWAGVVDGVRGRSGPIAV
jgi:rhamnosyltransferase